MTCLRKAGYEVRDDLGFLCALARTLGHRVGYTSIDGKLALLIDGNQPYVSDKPVLDVLQFLLTLVQPPLPIKEKEDDEPEREDA